MVRVLVVFLLGLVFSLRVGATVLFIPMDSVGQSNHLKAYGIVYAAVKNGINTEWLLNYKGGSFAIEYNADLAKLCRDRDVQYTKMTTEEYGHIVKEVEAPGYNGDVVRLEKVPNIAVYTPPDKEPWDDAVTLALTYAEIPFDKIYVTDVLRDGLDKYNWLHLHHEDFTGQYGKFFGLYMNTEWYQRDQKAAEELAAKSGFKKVSQMQLAVVKKIRSFVGAGGSLFAMCSATDTYDIALAADGVDICASPFDGDPMDKDAQQKLDFTRCFAFRDFLLSFNPMEYEYSNIDNTNFRTITEEEDYFKLSVFQAKTDPVPAMLCQNHTTTIKGFMGQTTAFRKEVIKPGVLVMADCARLNEARYIHGQYGKGSWTFYSGHDPEDYQHRVGAQPTDLSMHKTSPGYRLILNNVLFRAANKKEKAVTPCCDSVITATPKDTSPLGEESKLLMANRVKITSDLSNNEIIVTMIDGKSAIKNVSLSDASGKVVYKQAYSNVAKASISLNSLDRDIFLIYINGEYAGKIARD